MFKFIHAADIHLDSPLRGLERYEGAPAGRIRAATRDALENLVELAISEEADFVMIAGDLYDGDWKDYNTGLFFASQMSRLREARIRVYLISGNHDAASQISKQLRMPDNVSRFSVRNPQTVLLDDLGVAIHGQGFAKSAVTEDLAQGYPSAMPDCFNIGMLHTSATGREGHEPYAPCTVDSLLSKGYDYWALGHVHKREVLWQDPPVLFPGNIQGRHIRETGAKGCTLVSVDNDRIASVEHRDLDVIRWAVKSVDVTGSENSDEVLDRVTLAIREAMDENDDLPVALRLHVLGPCKAHSALVSDFTRIINEIRMSATDLSNGSVWIEKIKLQTGMPQNLEEMLNRDDPLGGLLRSIQLLSSGDEGLTDLVAEMSELKRKLPHELQHGSNSLELDDLLNRGEILEEVKQILIGRLLSRGSRS